MNNTKNRHLFRNEIPIVRWFVLFEGAALLFCQISSIVNYCHCQDLSPHPQMINPTFKGKEGLHQFITHRHSNKFHLYVIIFYKMKCDEIVFAVRPWRNNYRETVKFSHSLLIHVPLNISPISDRYDYYICSVVSYYASLCHYKYFGFVPLFVLRLLVHICARLRVGNKNSCYIDLGYKKTAVGKYIILSLHDFYIKTIIMYLD